MVYWPSSPGIFWHQGGGGGGGGGGGELLKSQCCIKIISFNVWVRYFLWNFRGYLWNSTQNILLILLASGRCMHPYLFSWVNRAIDTFQHQIHFWTVTHMEIPEFNLSHSWPVLRNSITGDFTGRLWVKGEHFQWKKIINCNTDHEIKWSYYLKGYV